MRTFTVLTMLAWSGLAGAKNVAPPTASPVVDASQDIHVIGQLNVNEASRDELLTVPGLEPSMVDALLETRHKAPIADVSSLVESVPTEAVSHLKSDGASDYRRIRALPLQVVEHVRTAVR
jgi:DNA uptake protein ComE-like DNA-binding protein